MPTEMYLTRLAGCHNLVTSANLFIIMHYFIYLLSRNMHLEKGLTLLRKCNILIVRRHAIVALFSFNEITIELHAHLKKFLLILLVTLILNYQVLACTFDVSGIYLLFACTNAYP
jgi:hypothetical protein